MSDFGKKCRIVAAFLRRRLLHLNLQILYQCNFKCGICDFWKEPYRGRPRLDVAQVEVIAAKVARIGPHIVSIGGGEPLMHPELPEIVRALSHRHFTAMITNGWFVTPTLARSLFAAGLYEASVSIDFADPAKHDAQRGRAGAHARGLEALRVLHAARTHAHQRVHMISVVMDDNLDEIEPLLGICASLGITYLVTLYSNCRGGKQPRPVASDVSAHLLRLKKQYPRFVVLRGYIARFSEAIAAGGIGSCAAGRNLWDIDSTGRVSLCIDRLDEPLGNILEDDIDNLVRTLRERHRNNDCRTCWTSCRGSIETLMNGRGLLSNLTDYRRMTRPLALRPSA